MVDPIVLKDFLLLPIYLLLISMWSRKRLREISNPELRMYFAWGLWLRVFGAVFFALLYQYYYHGGDTAGYYLGGRAFLHYLLDDPLGAISYLFTSSSEGQEEIRNTMYRISDYARMIKTPAEVLTLKFTGVLNVVGLNTCLSTSVLFGWIAFTGAWKLFKVFEELAPGSRKGHAIAALFIPSVIFWGSGILKDSITMTAVCYLTYHAWQLFGHSRKIVGNGLIVLFCIYVIATIKGYILLAFAPAMIFFLINQYKFRLKSGFARAIVTPAFVVVGLGLALIFVNRIGSSLGKYSLDNLEQAAIGTQLWHEHQSKGQAGSGYTLGSTDPTGGQMLKQFIPAVNVGLFRPYLWEAREPLQLVSAIEAAALLALTLFGLWKAGIRSWFRLFTKHPFLQFCLIFSIIFAFAVGFTSYNFGAMVRYRIPCLPFYAMFVLSMIAVAKEARAERQTLPLAAGS